MPARAEFELVGADRLARTVSRAARQLGDLRQPGADSSSEIARSARSRAPRRTGRLAGSIESGSSELEAFAGASAPYARPIEYGWPARRIRPQPYLEPAADESSWQDVYERYVGDVIATIEGI